jgi:uncharacterized repeat protein (TIGR02543 family)
MKGKFWSLCAALVLCLVLLPATAHAAEHEHPVCGATCDGDCGGGHSPATWQPFSTDDWNAMQDGKEYWFYLTDDVTVKDTLRIKNNTTVHLCLNGHILGSTSQDGIIFYVGSIRPLTSGNLTLCDCQTTEHSGHIDSETHLWTQGAGSGADTPCNLTGGVITGATKNCVYAHNGTFTMYGGNLAGNSATDGGAISLGMSDASFTMYGGTISGNSASSGGGIYASGPVTMYGGSISNNTASRGGGGIYASDPVTMYGGSISSNSASSGGGGIYASDPVTMHGGTISGNSASSGGGGIYASDLVTMYGGTISGNSASSGGGVYVDFGTCSIRSSVSSTASISNNFATYGGGVYVNSDDCTLACDISDNYATYGGGVYVAGGTCSITSGSSILKNSADNQGGGVYVAGGTCSIGSGSSILKNSASFGGGVSITNGTCNIKADSSIYNNSATYGGGVSVYGGVCNLHGSIYSNTADNQGGGVSIYEGVCNLYGSISNNTSAKRGGGVYVKNLSSTFKMYSGSSISGNSAKRQGSDTTQTGAGGGVFVESGSTFKMSGGSISGNSADNGGGGVFINSNGSAFEMSGDASISDNKASSGGGVYIENASTFKMSDNASISNNTASWGSGIFFFDSSVLFTLSGAPVIDGDIYSRQGNNLITIAAELPADTKFQLTNVSGTFTSGWSTEMSGKDPADYFILNKTGYHIGLSDDGEAAVLANTYTVKFDPNEGEGNPYTQIFTYDVAQNLTANAFTKTGYTFAGWSTAPDGSVVYTDTQPVSNLTAANGGTVTLYAQWTPNSYTVHFECNGGDNGSMSDQRFTYDAVQSLAPNGFTKTGHSFDGWSTTPDGSVVYTDTQPVSNLTAANGGTVTLYAQWTVNSYTVTLHPNGGTIADGKGVTSYTYGVGAALPTARDITRFSYAFLGWYDNAQCTGEPVTEITAADIGNKTYWANWAYISSEPSYSVLLGDYAHGSVHTSHRTPEAGTTVTLTVTPDEGYELASLTVTANSGSKLTLTPLGDGKYSFKMPAEAVTVDAVFVPAGTAAFPFTDVPESYWAYDEIVWVYTNGYMNGTSATTFNPGGTVTRQQVWMILARLSGADPANMAEAKAWAKANGISDGTNPGKPVTRQQLAAMLYRYAQSQGQGFTGAWAFPLDYPDADQVADYAYEALCWMTMHGIIGGMADGTLNPGGTSTRAQLAVMLYRWLS